MSREPRELIMVMGVQRSGTNALFNSLATDKTLSAFPEDIDSPFYSDFRLRPLSEIAPLIERASGRILLKPISETAGRSLTEVADEFRSFRLRFVWIYRDPVQVLDSMRRLKWISAEKINDSNYYLSWRKRNEYALQFHRQNRDQVAIVRYEDLCRDPAVFRKLTRWLGLNCESYFRRETAYGRNQLSKPAQHAVDDASSETLRALDNARRFRPTRLHRLKDHVSCFFHRSRRLGQATERPIGEETGVAVRCPSEPALVPSSVQGLYFWFHPSAIFHRNGPVETDVTESGPHQMVAARVENGPYAFLSLNRKAVLYYPHSKVEERRRKGIGSLAFGARSWLFLLSGAAFTIITLFRPTVPCYPPYHQHRSALFRVGRRRDPGPEFSLQWNGESNSSSAVFSPWGGGKQAVTATPPQSHPRQQWRCVVVQNSGGESSELSISANDRAGPPVSVRAPPPRLAEGDYVFELGGSDAESLFYGEVAEIIIFRRALRNEERSGILRYLTETYQV
jgi:hypothetical protein